MEGLGAHDTSLLICPLLLFLFLRTLPAHENPVCQRCRTSRTSPSFPLESTAARGASFHTIDPLDILPVKKDPFAGRGRPKLNPEYYESFSILLDDSSSHADPRPVGLPSSTPASTSSTIICSRAFLSLLFCVVDYSLLNTGRPPTWRQQLFITRSRHSLKLETSQHPRKRPRLEV